ncbi:MAG: hypothetical protein KKD07_04845 [Candidatus Omnitrophica bacterium]|nr:hypothetical protein [Candidatus Omnitrophota bacterium]MBU4333751.1 hypothetical protein [Candidatus Omnitrophota bacterium]
MKKILLTIFVLFSFVAIGFCQVQILQPTIKSDKEFYEVGEVIKITLTNDLSENIFSHIGSLTPVFAVDNIGKKDPGGNWVKLFAQCQYPHCMWDIDGPAEIGPRQSVSFEWNPLIYIDGTDKYSQARTGIYRLLILYQIRKDASSENWEWLKVYSNDFTIQ